MQIFKNSQMILEAPHKHLFVASDPQGGVLTDLFAENLPLNILIAEDDFINQKLIENILHRLGYRTDTVSNGIQVLNSLTRKVYNVILMDVRMPEMGGFEATQVIRQMEIEQPYIIAMTANAMSSDREECLNIGMNDYVAKPMRIPEIIKTLINASTFISEKNRIVIN
jgi:CheY-like chemotaxis protein